jgi:hypothetical protein
MDFTLTEFEGELLDLGRTYAEREWLPDRHTIERAAEALVRSYGWTSQRFLLLSR